MTGPEHYTKAEQLLDVAADEEEYDTPAERYLLTAAQVHATLALAAAAIHPNLSSYETTVAWQNVAAS